MKRKTEPSERYDGASRESGGPCRVGRRETTHVGAHVGAHVDALGERRRPRGDGARAEGGRERHGSGVVLAPVLVVFLVLVRACFVSRRAPGGGSRERLVFLSRLLETGKSSQTPPQLLLTLLLLLSRKRERERVGRSNLARYSTGSGTGFRGVMRRPKLSRDARGVSNRRRPALSTSKQE